ncbi:CNBD2_4 [Blepharisma stoltei]|uniref:Cyclic nucleotide-binding domain-containing protein n=1 Tax=Blepharisma stoltei TaxID=1481888 RepID=A0AAU9IKF9_9CILI|nr:unnamed protein product [Blepharisma stoltei]
MSLTNDESNQTLKDLISLLSKPSFQRSQKQLSTLKALTQNIKFFIKQVEESGEQIHWQACLYMGYEFIPKDEYVCHFGEFGTKFYIILDGEVSILVPTTRPCDNPEEGTETILTEVGKLSQGMAFGELALLKDIPRSATIQCVTDTHFAILEKEDYLKILGKVEAEKLDALIDFFAGIPLFRGWTKKAIGRLTYYFKSKSFIRKGIVYKQGEESEHVYIVKKGEFELTKWSDADKTPKYAYSAIGQTKKELSLTQVKTSNIIALVGVGEMLGDEEVMANSKMLYTCTCYSTSAEVLYITKKDFQMRVRGEESLNFLQNKIKIKENSRKKKFESMEQILDVKPQLSRVALKHLSQNSTSLSPINVKRNSFILRTINTPKHERTKLKPLSDKELNILKKTAILDTENSTEREDLHSKSFEKSITPKWNMMKNGIPSFMAIDVSYTNGVPKHNRINKHLIGRLKRMLPPTFTKEDNFIKPN